MNAKPILLAFVGLFIIMVATAVILKTSSPEDNWICQNGTWVKHGNPLAPMPTGTCKDGEQANPPKTQEETALPNPASQNCLDKGGKLEIIKETAGEYGLCKFPDGSECEEWKLFRNECSQGQSVKADASHPYQGSIVKSGKNYLFKDSSGTEYTLTLSDKASKELSERLANEADGKPVTIIASETPPLSKILILQAFQEK